MKTQKTKLTNKSKSENIPSTDQLCGIIENDIFDIVEHIDHCKMFLEFNQKIYEHVGIENLYNIDIKTLKYIEKCAYESIMLNSIYGDKCANIAENYGKDKNIYEADVIYAEGITERLKKINTISHDKMAYLQEMILASLNDEILDDEDKAMIKGFIYDENQYIRLFHGDDSHLKRHNQMVDELFNDFKLRITPFIVVSNNPNASKEKRKVERNFQIVNNKKTEINKEKEPELE